MDNLCILLIYTVPGLWFTVRKLKIWTVANISDFIKDNMVDKVKGLYFRWFIDDTLLDMAALHGRHLLQAGANLAHVFLMKPSDKAAHCCSTEASSSSKFLCGVAQALVFNTPHTRN